MPTRCNRGFYCRSYCLLNMFRAPLCPLSGAQEYYTVVAACGIWCCGFQVAGLVWSRGLCVWLKGCCFENVEKFKCLVTTSNQNCMYEEIKGRLNKKKKKKKKIARYRLVQHIVPSSVLTKNIQMTIM